MVVVGSLGFAGDFILNFFQFVPEETLTFSRPNGKTGWASIKVGLHPDSLHLFSGERTISHRDGGQDRGTMDVLNTRFYCVVTSKGQSSKRSLNEQEVLRATA